MALRMKGVLKMTDEKDMTAGGLEDIATESAQDAKSMELSDDLLSEASGGAGVTGLGTVQLVCSACGWQSSEFLFGRGLYTQQEDRLYRKEGLPHKASCKFSRMIPVVNLWQS